MEQENVIILTKDKRKKNLRKARIYGSSKYKCNKRAISQGINKYIIFEWITFTF